MIQHSEKLSWVMDQFAVETPEDLVNRLCDGLKMFESGLDLERAFKLRQPGQVRRARRTALLVDLF